MVCPANFTKNPCPVPSDKPTGCKFYSHGKCSAEAAQKEFTPKKGGSE